MTVPRSAKVVATSSAGPARRVVVAVAVAVAAHAAVTMGPSGLTPWLLLISSLGAPAPPAAAAAASGAASAAITTTGPSCESHGIQCIAGRGTIHDSTLGLTEAVWVGPEDRGIYVGSPSIWKTEAGPVLASHDFFGSSNQDATLNSTVQVLLDRTGKGDAGAKFEHVGNVTGMYWANLFSHPAQHQQLFLLGGASRPQRTTLPQSGSTYARKPC